MTTRTTTTTATSIGVRITSAVIMMISFACSFGFVWSSTVIHIADSVSFEVRSYDGTNNNIENPQWGSRNQPRIRSFPPTVSYLDDNDDNDIPMDEMNSNLPSARRVMEQIFRKAPPRPDKTASHVFLEFGHFIVQDILGSGANYSEPFFVPCDGELYDYVFCPVTGAVQRKGQQRRRVTTTTERSNPFSGAGSPPQDDDIHRTTTTMDLLGMQQQQQAIPFYRQNHHTYDSDDNNPRDTINGMTSYLDLSNIYGLDPETTKRRRQSGGKLKLTEDGLLPDTHHHHNGDDGDDDTPIAGINTTPGVYAIYVVFMRYHNLLADEIIAGNNTVLTDDEIFELARRKTIAVYQSFVEENYVPALLGDKMEDYQGYQPTINPSIDEFFAAVSFRYAHSSFSNTIRILDQNYNPTPADPLFLRDVFKQNVRGVVQQQGGIEPFLRGLTITPAKAVDASIVDDLNVWSEATSVLDVQRGRDVGIPRYNDVREAFGLLRMESIQALVADRYQHDDFGEYENDTNYQTLVSALKELYHDDINLVDAYVGALMEAPESALDNMGPLLTKSIQEQFTRLRDGDRFWYKNIYPQEEYEQFPTIAGVIKMVCKDMELFPNDSYVLVGSTGNDNGSSGDSSVCDAGSNQLSLLGGDFMVRWHVEGDTTNEENTSSEMVELTMTITEPMEGPGFIGIGWEAQAMNGADIWFCTVNDDLLQAMDPLPTECSGSPNPATVGNETNFSLFTCCLAPGTHHNRPQCAEPGDQLFYPLEVLDWCVSLEKSSVTVRAPICSDDETGDQSTTTRNCFRMESTTDGRMDFIVAYNTMSNSRPHGYQRRTNAQVDLNAGVLTQSEAATADDGLIATHGAFMLIGWLFLAPWGVFIVRYLKTWKRRLVAHISIMGVVGSMMVPLLIGVEASVGATDKTQQHALVGLIIMCMFFMMAGTGRFRYLKWEGHKIGKKTDLTTLVFHKYGGTIFIGLAWWNCYTGLCRIGPEDSEFQLVLFSNLHLGYNMDFFGKIRQYVYGPYIAFVILVFVLAEVRQTQLAGASQSALKKAGSLWDDDSTLDTMTLETFLQVSKLGNALCVVDGRVLDITGFIDTHPGGPELLAYVRGSDITEEFVGKRDVDGIQHVHSQGALVLMKKFVKAKLVGTEGGQLPKGRGSMVRGLEHSLIRKFQNAEGSMSNTFRRGKVLDVNYLAPSTACTDQTKPVILLRVALPPGKDRLKEKKVTRLPGCSFRFRGIDTSGLMFEREYTALLLDRNKEASLTRLDAMLKNSQISLRQLDHLLGSSSRSLGGDSVVPDKDNEKDECYDFIVSLIPGGQMSDFFLGLKTGKVLLVQGPKVNPRIVYKVESEDWKSVVMVAGGTGIASMLQLIDYYLEEKRVISGSPDLYLVWVLKSPGHSYHNSLALTERVRRSKGRLKWITVYSSSKEAQPEEAAGEQHPATEPTPRRGRRRAGKGTGIGPNPRAVTKGAPRRTISGPAAFPLPKRVAEENSEAESTDSAQEETVSNKQHVAPPPAASRRRAAPRRNISFDMGISLSGHRGSAFTRQRGMASSDHRESTFSRPSAFTNMNMMWKRNTTRLNVKDMIAFAKEDEFGADDNSCLGADKRFRIDADFWKQTPRQMTRQLDPKMLEELLMSIQENSLNRDHETEEFSESIEEEEEESSTSDDSDKEGERDVVDCLREHVTVDDREDGENVHKDCFLACEAVSFLLSLGYASSREKAVKIGQTLQRRQLIVHVTGDRVFADEIIFFRFSDSPQQERRNVFSSDLTTLTEDEVVEEGSTTEFSSFFMSKEQPPTASKNSLDVEEGERESKPFASMLVALCGSPSFEVGITEKLISVGLPRDQLMNFAAAAK